MGPNVRAILKKHFRILNNSDAAKELFPNGIMLASRREQNLKELLTRADPYSIKSDLTADLAGMGYKSCKKACDSCRSFVMEADKIKSSATEKTFEIRRKFLL